ncbi:unnamed protein product, partial [Pylaiella littoralis]
TCDQNVWSDKDTCKVTLSICCSPARITRTAASCACVTSGATLPLVSPQTRRTTVATPCGRTTTASSRTAQEPGAATAKPSRTQPSLAVTSSARGACAGTERPPSPRTSTLASLE